MDRARETSRRWIERSQVVLEASRRVEGPLCGRRRRERRLLRCRRIHHGMGRSPLAQVEAVMVFWMPWSFDFVVDCVRL